MAEEDRKVFFIHGGVDATEDREEVRVSPKNKIITVHYSLRNLQYWNQY